MASFTQRLAVNEGTFHNLGSYENLIYDITLHLISAYLIHTHTAQQCHVGEAPLNKEQNQNHAQIHPINKIESTTMTKRTMKHRSNK